MDTGGGALRTLNANVDVVLLAGLCLPARVVGLRERIEGLEILDVRGHEIDWSALLVLRRVLGIEFRWSGESVWKGRQSAVGDKRKSGGEGSPSAVETG